MLGLNNGNLNDAQIVKIVLQHSSGLTKLMRNGDFCFVDLGFKDVKQDLQDKAFTVLMPSLKDNHKQLTTNEAKNLCHVARIRWVVESIHGIIG